MMRFFKTPFLLKLIWYNYFWNQPSDSKTIYLTFDDGPIPEITEYVLDQLAEYQAHATFFCVGDNIRKHPDVFQKIIRQGHSVGNHTYNHLDGWKTPNLDYLENIRICQDTIDQVLKNSNSKANHQLNKLLFRPPYGKIKKKHYQSLKNTHHVIMWDVLTYDFDARLSSEHCLQKAIQNTCPGSIVVFHDSLKTETKLKFVLPQYLSHFKKLGFDFQRL